MTFEKYLKKNIVGSWRVQYIQYELLKLFIKDRPSNHTWSTEDETNFIQLFSNEYDKVKLFIQTHLSQLERRIQYCQQLLDHSQQHPSHDQSFCSSIDDSLIELLFDINDFSRFIHVNHIGFEKILSKHKKWTKIDHSNLKVYQHLIGSLEQYTYPFYAKVSRLRYQCRDNSIVQPLILTPELHPPQTSSKKYWISPDNLSEVTAILCIHMFVTFDNPMSNFYLDNQRIEGYFDRKNGKDNTGVIKFKRYEPDRLFIEQEIHNELPSGNQQLKRRFPVSYNPDHWQNPVDLNSIQEIEELENHDIRHQIKSKGLNITLQCDYHRLTFQMINNPSIRVTLDTKISYKNPTHEKEFFFEMAVLEVKTTTDLPGHISGLQSLIQNKDLVHEISKFSKYVQGIHQLNLTDKRLTPSEFPTWSDVLLLKQRKKRSTLENKFVDLPKENYILSRSPSLRPLLNGVPFQFSAHYPFQRSNSTNNSTINTKNTSEFTSIHIYDSDSSRSRSDYKPHNNNIIGGGGSAESSSDTSFNSFNSMEKGTSRLHVLNNNNNSEINTKRIMMKKKGQRYLNGEGDLVVKVEPKVFFANERTFISWLQFCALLLTVALNLLNFGDKTSKICGAMFLLIAILLALYALVRFQCRARMLRQQSQGRYDDLYGPIVLCILIVGALIINFWLRFK